MIDSFPLPCLGDCAAQYAGGAAQQTGDTSSWHTGGITCLLLLLHHADHTGHTGDVGDVVDTCDTGDDGDNGDSGDSRLDRAASF